MKKYLILLLLLFVFACSQKEPAGIIFKGTALQYPNNSSKDLVYVESPDGKIARSLRGTNNIQQAEEINIIDEDMVDKEERLNRGKKRNSDAIIITNDDGSINTNSRSIKQYYKNDREAGYYAGDDKAYHRVVEGDSVWSIAKQYNMTINEIVELNDLYRPYNIYVGQRLKVNENPKIISNTSTQKVEKLPDSSYVVKSGDVLSTIAEKFNMTTIELAELNNLSAPYNIKVGDILQVKTKSTSTPTKSSTLKTITYTVQSGDNLSMIADKYNTRSSEIAELNNLKQPYLLAIGQKLKIRTNDNIATNIAIPNTYTVKAGDNLSLIANKFNISSTDIIDINNLEKPYTLYVGQKLKLQDKPTKKSSTVSTSSASNIAVKTTTNKTSSTSPYSKTVNSFSWPLQGSIISSFGNKSNDLYNDGINISAPKGTEFKSSEDGVVAYVGNELRGYGTIILIKHSNNWISAYAHCESVKVAKGDKVSKGQVIGTVGSTGSVSSPQLYFSLRKGRDAVDPIKYLDK